MKTYFDYTDYLSNSALTAFQNRTRCFPPGKQHHAPPVSKEHLHGVVFPFGRLLDYAITEPHRVDFGNNIVNDEQTGTRSITEEDGKRVRRMMRHYFKDKFLLGIHNLLDKQKEFYRLNFHGLKFKAKLDGYNKEYRIGMELKGLSVHSENALDNAVDMYDYDRQVALYMDIAQIDEMVLVVLRKDGRGIFKRFITPDSPVYRNGRAKYLYLITAYKNYKNINYGLPAQPSPSSR